MHVEKNRKINKIGLFLYTLFYFVLGQIHIINTLKDGLIIMLLILITGAFFSFKSLTISFFVYLIPIINPIGNLNFDTIQFVFVLSILALALAKFHSLKSLIKEDRYVKKFIFAASIFTLYQVYSYFISTDTFANYIHNIRQILGIYFLIPAYYLILTDRKNFFLVLLLTSSTTFILYYLSYFDILHVFKITFESRGLTSEITRVRTREFCYLVKIIAYFLPVTLFIKYTTTKIQLLILLCGMMAYGILFMVLLRLDLVYTFLGGIMCLIFITKKFKIGTDKMSFSKAIILISVILIIFNKQFITVVETYTNTYTAIKGQGTDSSLEQRKDIEIPILILLFLDEPIFGVGNDRVIKETITNHNFWSNDMPLLSSLAMYGIVGILIYLARFTVFIKSFRNTNIPKDIFDLYKTETIVFYALFSFFIAQIFLKLYLTFAELISNETYAEFGVLFGLYFGLRRFLEIKTLTQ